MYVKKDVFQSKDIVFTNSSSEAIEMFFDFISYKQTSVILPLPCYFKYDLLACRKKISTLSYYNNIGGIYNVQSDIIADPTIIINNPEAISGKLNTSEFYSKLELTYPNWQFKLYDFCYLLMDNYNHNEKTYDFLSHSIKQNNIENNVFIFSPSKDISLASYRAGVLISKNEGVLNHAKNIILERYFTLNMYSTFTTILYFCILNIGSQIKSADKDKVIENLLFLLKEYGYINKELNQDFFYSFFEYYTSKVLSFYMSNFDYMIEKNKVFTKETAVIPDAGFSALWKLNRDLPKMDSIISTIQNTALNFNSNIFSGYYNGGQINSWDYLYPNSYLIRLNSSIPFDILKNQINVLNKIYKI